MSNLTDNKDNKTKLQLYYCMSFVYHVYINKQREAYMRKLINFNGMEERIQAYADKYFEGNFNMAVRMLVAEGLICKS